MKQPFGSSGGNLSGFARSVVPVTPSDTVDLFADKAALGLICKGVGGDVSFIAANGETVTGYPLAFGEVLPVGILRVLATGTNATDIWAFVP